MRSPYLHVMIDLLLADPGKPRRQRPRHRRTGGLHLLRGLVPRFRFPSGAGALARHAAPPPERPSG